VKIRKWLGEKGELGKKEEKGEKGELGNKEEKNITWHNESPI
jgi:hypothetical protein